MRVYTYSLPKDPTLPACTKPCSVTVVRQREQPRLVHVSLFEDIEAHRLWELIRGTLLAVAEQCSHQLCPTRPSPTSQGLLPAWLTRTWRLQVSFPLCALCFFPGDLRGSDCLCCGCRLLCSRQAGHKKSEDCLPRRGAHDCHSSSKF